MSRSFFGTDGMRGVVNQHPVTPDIILKFGMAAGVYFASKNHRTKALIAKDTRLSGYLMEPALTAGLISVGADVILLGPMPTPAIAMLVKSLRADFGIMISASHNPYYDNGLKLFDSNGNKLSDACEQQVQNLIMSAELTSHLSTPEKLGRAARLDDALGRYIEHIKNSFPKNHTLSGMRIVVDCANGSAYKVAPTVLWELGAEVISIGCDPNGFNINEYCGSMQPSVMSQRVLETRADLGIALDGDADRVVICDETGEMVHGDSLIAAIALHLKATGKLKTGVVASQLSNSALDVFLKRHSIETYRAQVGDRYIALEMKQRGCNLGGEQSGHLIFGDYSTTGDGLIAALQILSLLVSSRKKASHLNKLFPLNPQLVRNFSFDDVDPLQNKSLLAAMEQIKARHSNIKILLRKSGTEKVIRLMIEGEDSCLLAKIADEIAALFA